jgi:hypothetical protein
MEYKKCTQCGFEKEISCFSRRKNSYRSACKECEKKYDREYQKTDKRKSYLEKLKTDEKRIEYKKNHRKEYEDSEKRKVYENSEKYKDYKRTYNRNYIKKRKQIDPLFKLSFSIRNRIRESLNQLGFKKCSKTRQILGCEIHEFKTHLESLFLEGMSWENYGKDMSGWQLDHIVPVSSARNCEELIKLNHYTNFQPLWALDNLKKSNKI